MDSWAGTEMKGFTLLEVLVALSIFALIGLGSNQLLRTVIDTRDATQVKMAELNRLQRVFIMIERDLVQLTDRSIRNEFGDPLPAIELSAGDYDLELSRLGWRNPAAMPRSNIQRVAYSLNEKKLERHYWEVLDRAEDSKPRVQVLMEGVDGFRVNAVDEEGDTTDYWSSTTIDGINEDDLPEDSDEQSRKASSLPPAVEIIVTLQGLGEIRRLVDLVEVADPIASPGQGDGNGNRDDQTGDQESEATPRPGNPDPDGEIDEGEAQYRDE
jgi:general secretion pathway protein J